MNSGKSHLTHEQFIATAIEAINTEKAALSLLTEQIDDRFAQACDIILACQGRLVVTGMGKSGLIGRKIAATFASTGTPAFFMHPGEAGHGDLGMLVRGDVLLAISNSGESDEIKTLLPVVKRLGIPLISISRDKRGMLPRAADVVLTLG
ncbi:MAG: SIS domain-containing protein, partial [Psychrobacter sp.]